MEYRKGAHTIFNIQYHFVWVTKYRYHVLVGEVKQRTREVVRQVCLQHELNIEQGHVRPYSLVGIGSEPYSGKCNHAKGKGQKFTDIATRISPPKEAILGTTYLGKGVFLCHCWAGDK